MAEGVQQVPFVNPEFRQGLASQVLPSGGHTQEVCQVLVQEGEKWIRYSLQGQELS